MFTMQAIIILYYNIEYFYLIFFFINVASIGCILCNLQAQGTCVIKSFPVEGIYQCPTLSLVIIDF